MDQYGVNGNLCAYHYCHYFGRINRKCFLKYVHNSSLCKLLSLCGLRAGFPSTVCLDWAIQNKEGSLLQILLSFFQILVVMFVSLCFLVENNIVASLVHRGINAVLRSPSLR